MPQTDPRPLTIEDICALRTVGDPQISPDGTRVAYVLQRVDHDRNKYLSQIWVVDTASGETWRYTTGEKRDTSPRWSPDGRYLAFLSDRAGKRQLWLIDTEGGEARQLTDVPNGAGDPAWAPDSRRLAFTGKVGEAYAEGKTSDGDTYKPPRVFRRNRYKADGEGYLDDTRRHIFVVEVGEGDAKPEPKQITEGDWEDNNPVWSPDGERIAFTSNRTADRDYTNSGDLWTVSASGGEPTCLTEQKEAGAVVAPSYSPDGRLIAFFGHEGGPVSSGYNMRLWVVAADGSSAPRCLTSDVDRSFGNLAMSDIRQTPPVQPPHWSPDGRTLYAPAGDHGDTPLFAVSLEGEARKLVDGRRSCVALSGPDREGRLAVLIGDALNPGDVFLVEPSGGEPRQLTHVNRDALAGRWIGAPEKFTYTGRDGNQVDGWLIKPPGFDPAKQYPLKLKIHGGPHAMYGEAFQHEFQWYAGMGFVVLYTNPRGSQGYGQDHALCVRAEWGDKDYADVMAGVDAAIAKGFVDPERMAVGGASYGGYMTSWVIGHTTRFAAAICERPVSNWYSFYGTSDIGFTFAPFETGGLPQRDLETYMRHSPITYADAVKTPTLVVCGDADHRTPIEQSEQLYISLHRNRVPTEFLRYPDEPHAHSVSGQPRHRTDRLHRIEAWLRRFIPSLDPS